MAGKNRDLIVYIPYRKKTQTANSNEYVSNMIGVLEEKYHVAGNLANPLQVSLMLRTKAVFLNWIEDTGLNRWVKIRLIIHKIFGVKIIWVFHNRYPHDTTFNKVSTGNMNWLAKHSNIIVLHSKCSKIHIPGLARNGKKAVYVPHILYDSRKRKADINILKQKYGIKENEFVFTIFGRIRPYKNIERGIEAFRDMNVKNVKLLIAGAPVDAEYAKRIKYLCRKNENIALYFHYLSDSKLNELIDLSDVILLTHKDRSSMNSGVMIQAFSRGKTVISPDICMARDLIKYNFFYMYQDSLHEVMLKAYNNGKCINDQMGKRAQRYLYRNNNKEVVKNRIYDMLK